MTHIKLSAGKQALVDPEWKEFLSKYRWKAWQDRRTGNWHAVRYERGQRLYMENHIAAAPKGKLATHRNADTLDNRRANLRLTASPRKQWWHSKRKGGRK